MSLFTIPYSDYQCQVKKKVEGKWNEEWRLSGNKMVEIKQNAGKWKKETRLSRAEPVKVNRLRVGHSLFSHGYMMEDIKQWPPQCQECQQAT